MKLKFVILFFLGFLQVGVPLVNAQKNNNRIDKFSDNKGLWSSVDSLSNLGQPKSALALVEKIYASARSEKNDPQFIKAILYRLRLTSDFSEDFFTQTLNDLKQDLLNSSEPATSLLHSIIAEVYWKYYQNNSYRFNDRTRTESATSVNYTYSDSISTWDLKTLSEAIANEYLLSISSEILLQGISIHSFEAILDVASSNKKNQEYATSARPTLFDFLAHRALEYFSVDHPLNPSIEALFNPDQAIFFSPTKQFITLMGGSNPIPNKFFPYDSISPTYFAFRIYQNLASFHLKSKQPEALIETELDRLAFFNNHAPENDTLYLPALILLEKEYQSIPFSTNISFQIAEAFQQSGETYIPLVQEKHKWDLKSAITTCEGAIKRFPNSMGANNCKILLNTLLSKSLQITNEVAVPIEKPSLALISFKNLEKADFRLVKMDPEVFSEKSGTMKREELFKYVRSISPAKQWSVTLPGDGDHQQHTTEVSIPACESGFYVLICTSDRIEKASEQGFAISTFWATQIGYSHKRNNDGSITVYLLDRELGSPLKNLSAEAWIRKYNYATRTYESEKIGTFHSDDNGMFLVPPVKSTSGNRNIYFKIHANNDMFITGNLYQFPQNNHTATSTIHTRFFTDRAIYRPGQTIYFKGIVLETTGKQTQIKPGQSTTVTFYDVNGQAVSSQKFITNTFGSFNGSFFIPKTLLLGQMSLSNETGSIGVSVEEYKRPTFEVILNPLEGNYKLNESLALSGRARTYTESPITNQPVKYRVVRSVRYPSWGRSAYPFPPTITVEIARGTTHTDTSGTFSFNFVAHPDLKVKQSFNPVFDFAVYIDVTDAAGETQSCTQNISVGYSALLINADIPQKVNLAGDSIFKITTTNLNGRQTPTQIRLTIERLSGPDQTFIDRSWTMPDLFLMTRDEFKSQFPHYPYKYENMPENWQTEGIPYEMEINTKTDTLFIFKDLAPSYKTPGVYRIILAATDPFGVVVKNSSIFSLFNPASREMPSKEINWFVPLKTIVNPGDKARFMVGSSEKNLDVMYEIRMKDSVISRHRMVLNNSASLIEVPIEERYRGNVVINFLSVRYNRIFQNSQLITVPYPSKRLDITFETFRSKLSPGSSEQWRIKILNPDRKPAVAELLTTLYDASLDVFRPNTWNFDIAQPVYGLTSWDINDAFRTKNSIGSINRHFDKSFTSTDYPQINWFGLPYFGHSHHTVYNKRQQLVLPMDHADNEIVESQSVVEDLSIQETSSIPFDPEGSKIPTKEPQKEPTQDFLEHIQLRKDFQETLFFYPDLTTDSLGNLIIQFKAPESLSRWKMLGLAYTKNLDFGLFEREIVTQKEIMVIPNVPRFIRQGDTLIFTARIINLSDRNLSGEARIQFYDGITGKAIEAIILPENLSGSSRSKTWFTEKGATSIVMWKIHVPENSDLTLLQYKIAAQADNFSDGEENFIPVLTNRLMVTESLPLSVRGKGTFDFDFEKLANSETTHDTQTLNNYRLTLEFSSNPAWYAVQALPVLNEKKYTNADAIFSAFYSNCLASHILEKNPQISAVFQSWTTLTPNALLSNLNKNEMLKSALLQETPWVLTAQEESERKQNLGLYFNHNNLKINLQENSNGIKRLQKSNGGWVWFEGMPENRWLTQNIVSGIGHLYHLGVPIQTIDPEINAMINKALQYLDSEIQKDFETLKRGKNFNPKEQHLTPFQIQYLYTRSYFPNIKNENPGYKKAFDFFQQQATGYWQKYNRYLQGMIALFLNRQENNQIPSLIIKSLKENAISSSETGLHWAEKPGYNWYEAPVETQAMMIEVFDEVGHDEKAVEEMKIWLLKQKQTQAWPTSRATLEAIYALLLRGDNLLSEEARIRIKLGNEKVDSRTLNSTKIEAGTGYFQQIWQGKEVSPEMGRITVMKSNQGVSWGALYWQYFQNLDKITDASTPLKLNKELFIKSNSASGPILLPLSENSTLRVGDEIIVKIILTSDRDLEYVHMKDLRAAAFEPKVFSTTNHGLEESTLSGYRYQDGLSYYQTTTDMSTNFFFEILPRGSYVFEYPLIVNASGSFSNGITTIQCMYAPEFSAHSEGMRVHVNEKN